MTAQDLIELRHRLLANADLFDDPSAYRAGVDDVIDALSTARTGRPASPPAVYAGSNGPLAPALGWFG